MTVGSKSNVIGIWKGTDTVFFIEVAIKKIKEVVTNYTPVSKV
jgi:hypothetical protein